ncbi:MAG: DUF697 domain-containing protein [Bacteroidaceae bacterium]|nr:DUF697 domain-containing protein [Bacteroidaceae bacterium]
MSKKSIHECDEQADDAIRTMVATVVGTAAIPAHVNWSLTATAMGAGVVAIGLIYDVQLTKEEGWKLVRQFFLGAGFWFVTMNVGSKILTAIMESTGFSYLGGVALDGAISAASAWAIGACAKEYFRRDFLGKSKPTKEELGEIFREAFKKNKK